MHQKSILKETTGKNKPKIGKIVIDIVKVNFTNKF